MTQVLNGHPVLDRQPAQDLDAERTLIATAMVRPELAAQLMAVEFYLEHHQSIIWAIAKLHAAGANVTVPDILRELGPDASKVIDRVPLVDLMDPAFIAADPGFYVDIVNEKSQRRRLSQFATSLGQRVEAGADLSELTEMIRAEGAAESRTLGTLGAKVLTRSQLATLPAPRPLIDGTLDLATVAVLAGWWGTCKSFVGIDWAASIATGQRWHGRMVEQRRVLYIAGEGAYGLDQRLAAWESARSCSVADTQFQLLPVAVNLGVPSQVAETSRLVAAGGFQVVFVDTIAKCAVGLDENSAQDMGRVVDALYRIREATGDGTVIALHHTGKDRVTVRGSSAIEAGVDTVYMTEGDPKALKLSRSKRKDGPADDILTLSLEVVEGTGSAILMSAGGADISGRARDLMSVFMSAFSVTGATKADLRGAAEMPPATFARALNTLVSTGVLINDGTDQRPFYRVVT